MELWCRDENLNGNMFSGYRVKNNKVLILLFGNGLCSKIDATSFFFGDSKCCGPGGEAG